MSVDIRAQLLADIDLLSRTRSDKARAVIWARICESVDALQKAAAREAARSSDDAAFTAAMGLHDIVAALRAENAAMTRMRDVVGHALGMGAYGVAWAAIEAARSAHSGSAVLRHITGLRAFVQSFAEVAEAAVRHHEGKDRGGQQVPFHGEFAHVPPSVVGTLRKLAREAREVLKEPTP